MKLLFYLFISQKDEILGVYFHTRCDVYFAALRKMSTDV